MSRKLLNLCLASLLGVVSTAAWALSDVNGVYQIGTAADLEEFAVLVNEGNVYANAELTADIDRGIDGTMIGTSDNKYRGTFDGKGHSIKINMYPEEEKAALFQYTGFGAIIQDLKVTGTITTSNKFAAGIVAENYGTIRGCYVDITINSSVPGDATHGGIVARGFGGTTVENCLAKIAILGETTTNCGGVVGWASGRSNIVNCLVVSDGCNFAYADASNGHSNNLGRNEGHIKAIDVETYNADPYTNRPGGACYNNYVTNQWGDNVATTVVAYEDLADGRICYQLNNDQSKINWVQTIGTDPFPVPAAFGSGQVYASVATGCDGLTQEGATYSNSGSDQAMKHQFDKYGVCPACGCFDFHYFENADKFDPTNRTVLLGTVEDIDKVEGWNRIANGFRLNMKMVNDIEYIAEPGKYIFNPSDWIDGNFNGDGHTFTIGMTNIGEHGGLFPEMAGNVENLILRGSITTDGTRTGSIAGEARMALVRNVFSDVNITTSIAGDNTSGGLFGWMGDVERNVENTIYAGTFTCPQNAPYVRVGGFCGWAGSKTYFTNCAFLGNVIGAGDQSAQTSTENSASTSRNPGNIVCENVYVVNPVTGRDVQDTDKYTLYENEAGIASGELAFFLNGMQSGLDRFYQIIGTDPEPMPIAKVGGLVYSASSSFRCDGTPLDEGGYTNDPSGEAIIPPHTFVDGWCTVCGKFDENFVTPVDGWFDVSNGAELAWWSNYANAHKDVCVRLTDDIDMSDYMGSYVPVEMFVGEFDGQGHTISNFVLESVNDYSGLISTIADGANIHDFMMDESCFISGGAFVGIIGGTSGSGNIYITNVGNEGDVTGTAQNVCGILGVDQGGSMTLHIRNCWVTGTITAGRESAAICGYSSGDSEVINCWAVFTINQSGIYDCDSFTRGGAKVTNCYEADIPDVDTNKQQHYRQMGANRATILLPLEDVASGALCYNLNGKQFLDPAWFQTIDDDVHPYPFDNHGVVIFCADKFFSVPNSDIDEIANEIQNAEQEAIDNVIATQSLIEEWAAAVEALTEATDNFEDFAAALAVVEAAKAAVAENAAIYQAYINKCEEIKTYLDEHTDFEGDLRTALEDYLSDVEEPNDDNPLGTYEYIVDIHTATAEEIAAETERIIKWLAEAINNGYIAGTDVSNLLVNSDFSQQNEGWTGGFGNSWGSTVSEETGKTVYGVEAWNVTGDMYQTVEGLKPGYYLVGTHGAFRPSNNRYSKNYAAGIYANGIFNYFPAAIEDPVLIDDAEDGVNCNLTIGGAKDLPIYEDGISTSGEVGVIGYVIQGETGMAIAAKAGRYPAYTIAKVGEDGKLTVGIKNPGTQYSSDWTGWGAINMVYCSDDEDMVNDALDTVIENMVARAWTIIDSDTSLEYQDNPSVGPNFPQELRDALEALVAQVEEAEDIEAKEALVKQFSDLFQTIYEGKQAYVNLFNYASTLESFEAYNLDLVEKDEAGEWFDTGETIFSEDETEAIYDAYDPMFTAFTDGSYSIEQALNPAASLDEATAAVVSSIMPEQDADGYYLIGNRKQFAAYRTIASELDRYAKGKLIADIDMSGVAMLPIGHNRDENAQHIFMGELDGQGHALDSVYIDDIRIPSGEYAEPATLFYELQNATVKNLKLTGEFYTSHQFSGPVTRWMSGKSTIDNCEIAVAMHFAENLNGDTSSGGVIGRNGSASSLISNCLVKTHLIGEGDAPHWYVGGVAGWADAALPIKNTLILSEYTNVGVEGDNSQTIARGAGASATNVFVSQYFRGQQGTLVSAEQLASGETCWKLNGSTSDDAHWFQTLGTEEAPHLFDGDVVYLYGGEYINDKPNPQLNAYAYDLEANVAGQNVVVSFKLNAEAESAEVRFNNGYTQTVGTDLAAGAQRVIVPASELGEDPTAFNFEIAVTGKGSLDVLRVGDVYKVWAPYGMAVNNNPASKNFGQVMIAETWATQYPEGYISTEKSGALFAYDQNFKPINAADGTPGFYGGLPIPQEIEEGSPLVISGGLIYDLKDLRFSADGRLFVARASGTDNSSVWEINPEDLDEPWKPVFTGGELDDQTGITYVDGEEQNRMAVGLAFEGQGEDLKMYVLGAQRSNGENNATDYNCAFYNLGTATEWATTPSGYVAALDGVYCYAPSHIGIHEDGQGGLWFIQSVGEASAEKPAVKHFDAEGNEDYSSTTSNIGGGKIAVTHDGNYIAMPNGSGKIVLYETNYVPMENGKIFLNPKTTINVRESSLASFAFDWANNLYVASGGTETFSRYTIPGMPKVVVTPGNGIGNGIIGDVNSDGRVDGLDAQAILNVMSDNGYTNDCDVNKDGRVDGLDYQTVLNIMSD